ncbi:MAG TPA: sugar transferase [Verrucomicrobiae bacterium]|nr:sugar transferase [Verrucomicrobiae bacterium]
MLGRERQIRATLQRLLDASLFGIGLWLAHWIREAAGIEIFGGTREIPAFHEFLPLFAILPFTPLLLELQGYYNRPILSSRRQGAWILLKGCALAVVLIIFGMFLRKWPNEKVARSVVIMFGITSFFLILLKDELVRRILLSRLGESQFKRRLILAGSPEDLERFVPTAKGGAFDGLEIVAQIDLNKQNVEDLVEMLHFHSANAVVISAKHTYFGQVEKAVQACELEGVEAWLLADFFNTQVCQTSLDELSGRPVLVFRSTPSESWQKVAKSVLDFVGALIFLTLGAIPFAICAALVKFSSPGPVFFRQQRAGLNGRPFMMLKFRSMISNAEQRKHELERLNEMNGPVFKVTNDPRVTRVGRVLRKWSIDEWPQMINVLRGEMSLVGPRPLPVDEVKRFDDVADRRRLSVKPGLTCLWQVSGRNTITNFKEWVRLDLQYIDNWSFWLDLQILAKTIPAVLKGTGAK